MKEQGTGRTRFRLSRPAAVSLGFAALAVMVATTVRSINQPVARPAGAAPAESVLNAPELMNQRLALAAAKARAESAGTPFGVADALPPGLQVYRVEKGDTLWDIAQRFGSSVEQIAASNDLGRGDLIGPGKNLVVPTVPGFAYRIKPGDTVSGLGLRFGITAESIQTTNGLDASDVLQPGQLIFLPGAKPPSLDGVRVASTSRSLSGGRAGASWLWPVRGLVTSGFGWRWGSFHEGIDIAVAQGTVVRASRGGRVTQAGWDGGYGKAVLINHGDGTSSLYAHLSEIEVSYGEQVDQGERIGLSGSTGNSTGPHLHFEIRVGGSQKNPRSYLP